MIQKWFKNRQSILLKAGDQQKSVLPTKIINYEINKNLDSSEQFDSKKKERRKRGKS